MGEAGGGSSCALVPPFSNPKALKPPPGSLVLVQMLIYRIGVAICMYGYVYGHIYPLNMTVWGYIYIYIYGGMGICVWGIYICRYGDIYMEV